MRFSAVVLAILVAGTLGAVQGVASVALRDRAVAPAPATFVPTALGEAIDRISPRVPLPEPLRLILARRALDRGDVAYASEVVARLSASRDRLALEADLAERRGDRAAAVRAFLAADDLAGVESAVARLESAHRHGDALALQADIVARLAADRTQPDALAQATYELGNVRQSAAYAYASGDPARRALERGALDAYRRATELSPLSIRYLIALANQRINVGDLTGARHTFERARDVDPTSAEPWTGLGDLALRAGDRTTALAMLARARALDPQSTAVARLASELHA